MRKLSLVLALGLSMAGPMTLGAEAQMPAGKRVQDLLPPCEALMITFRTGRYSPGDSPFYCLGMMQGIAIILQLNCESRRQGYEPAPNLSMELYPSAQAGVQTFINWARANPQQWGIYGPTGMAYALAEAFPCER